MTTAVISTMKAVHIHHLGGPEELRFEDVPKPEPAAHEVLVRIHAAGVNPLDWKIREGLGGRILLPAIMGSDFSGVVEALGPEVTEFAVGEEVFGSVADESGSYAEYAVADVMQIAPKPRSLDHIRAAALPLPAMTAWQALFDVADLQPRQTVLVHAAAGGVGGFAVQFAKWKGAHAIGTASPANDGFVRELGAEQVVDYRTTRFEEVISNVDVVLDTIGGDTQERSWKTLNRGGILVSIVQPPDQKAAAAHGVRGALLSEDTHRRHELAQIASLAASGRVAVNVETVLPLDQARRAQEVSQTGHARGRIVLAIHPESAANT